MRHLKSIILHWGCLFLIGKRRRILIGGLNTYENWRVMIHKAAHFAAWTLNNPWTLAPMCMALVFVPVLGMWAVHKYGWEHWEPFDKGHK